MWSRLTSIPALLFALFLLFASLFIATNHRDWTMSRPNPQKQAEEFIWANSDKIHRWVSHEQMVEYIEARALPPKLIPEVCDRIKREMNWLVAYGIDTEPEEVEKLLNRIADDCYPSR